MQFISWTVAEEVRNNIVMLNAKEQAKEVVKHMYSKDLTIRRNNVLKMSFETIQVTIYK